MTETKISIVAAIYGTEHLIGRSLYTWANQDCPKEWYEFIIISDGAWGDVKSIIWPYRDKMNIQFIQMDHNFGMRGNCCSLNVGWMCAKGILLGETTPETMFTPSTVRVLISGHYPDMDMSKPMDTNKFVIYKTFNLTMDDQLLIDTVDWKSDLNNLSKLPNWNSEYTQRNKNLEERFGTHQTDSIRKDTWYKITNGYGWMLTADYGTDDPWMVGLREKNGIEDLVVLSELCVHQHHLPFQWHSSRGAAPNLTKDNHTTSNYMNDVSGRLSEKGTQGIWNSSEKDEPFTKEEIEYWRSFDEYFIKAGGHPKYLEDKTEYYKKYGY